ncbi:signal peptide peptidase SppA [Galbibacter sp. EGI 63066]|uniref:signal peptide peptidase SppA n=1 Tax=Galbibacter sp. EGI 63066 TaxID=2993559 RepID=UPI002248ABE6|nr:signal peptide peptidase SppA [Galbibacter sp. EGI 63066]MCX2681620.1 signal peptide peptidase SppA [Galbibacter sp. EGI 63066]
MKFLRNLLAAILGTLIALGIIFMFFLIIATLTGSSDQTVAVKSNSVLEINFKEPIKDYGGKYKFTDIDYKFEEYNGLNTILPAIRAAAKDDKIKGISINNSFLTTGAANTKAIRDAIEEFKESGKFVYAYGDIFLQKDYYLASVADSVFLNPAGELDFRGLSSEVLYLKDLQEKSGIKMEVIRHGKYKSAVEPYLTDEMSDENREQISELLSSVWNTYLEDIAESRGQSVEQLNAFADELAARSPELALENNFVDGLSYVDQYNKLLRENLNLKKRDKINSVNIIDYAEYVSKKKKTAGKDKIAVVYAQGEIGFGKGNDNYIGQEVMSKALKAAREDDDVKAIVLRINSPGGMALTSDIIWREIEVTKKVKPVVVSMGNLAASGGYYMAVAGDKIFAEPATITGSIGVFATIPNASRLAEKWGINAEQVNTNENATAYSLFEPASDSFKAFAKEGIEDFYQDFLQKVADGRNLSVPEVDSVAQGRVWSGVQAKEHRLVDEIGGLNKAVAYAAQTTGAEDYVVANYPVYETNIKELLQGASGLGFLESREDVLKEELGEEIYNIMQRIKAVSTQKGLQARMPFEINIK